MTTEVKRIRAEVPTREANEAEAPVGSVPRPLRNDAKADPMGLADNRIPCGASYSLSLRT